MSIVEQIAEKRVVDKVKKGITFARNVWLVNEPDIFADTPLKRTYYDLTDAAKLEGVKNSETLAAIRTRTDLD